LPVVKLVGALADVGTSRPVSKSSRVAVGKTCVR